MDKKVKIVDLHNLSDNNFDYYYVVLNIGTKDYFLVKNPSCLANVEHYLADTYNIPIGWVGANFKIIWNFNDGFINLNRIPKKYQKYFE